MKKFAIILVLVLLLGGCSKRSPTTAVRESKLITGELEHWGTDVVFLEATLMSDPVADAKQSWVQAKVGGVYLCYASGRQTPSGVNWYGAYDVQTIPGTECSLTVQSNIGNSRGGGVRIPGPCSLLVPVPYDTLPWGDVQFVWTRSLSAEWYDLGLSYYAYGDSGRRYLGYYDTLMILSDTTALLPQAFFRRFPSATYLSLYANFLSHCGAKSVPGEIGNMTGEIKGFFYSTYDGSGTLNFYMGSPKANPVAEPPPRITKERRRKAILRAFGVL